MKLIAGLGNPGKQYEKTRHNSGYMTMALLSEKCGISLTSEKFNALIAPARIHDQSVLLMEPLTFMNESGLAVVQAVHYYHIEPQDILILHDDMDLPVGSVRIRTRGASAGQKGMQSIIDALGTQEISRIRIGIGHDVRKDVPDYVLSAVGKEEWDAYEISLHTAADAAFAWAWEPMEQVMSQYNTRVKKVLE